MTLLVWTVRVAMKFREFPRIICIHIWKLESNLLLVSFKLVLARVYALVHMLRPHTEALSKVLFWRPFSALVTMALLSDADVKRVPL